MGYQTFPWEEGSSQSLEKLAALYLPPLKGKALLDVGCNTGFFCGFAAFQGASRVRGIDKSPDAIERAKLWFPECSFLCSDWDALGKQQYDVILCLSAIHYAADYQKLIDGVMQRLHKNGVFVLELGIAPGDEAVFVPVERRISETTTDCRNFPTGSMLLQLLKPYVYKLIGPSVAQAGDPLPRYVYHIMHRKPHAVLLMDSHFSGKTSVANAILNPEILRVHGDTVYEEIVKGSLAVSDELKLFVKPTSENSRINSAQITQDICSAGQLSGLLHLFSQLAQGADFVLDHYIPEAYRGEVRAYLEQAGYYVVDIALSAAQHPGWHTQRTKPDNYVAYIKYLMQRCQIDEEAYLAANPDIASAVAAGKYPSGRYHYWHYGLREKRRLR